MPIPIIFDKEKTSAFVSALAEGGPIPHEGTWTYAEMLMLAGACYFCVMSHGPRMAGRPQEESHHEHQEALEETFQDELVAAVKFTGMLSQQLLDGEFDEQFESYVEALVGVEGTTLLVRPVKGFRKRPRS